MASQAERGGEGERKASRDCQPSLPLSPEMRPTSPRGNNRIQILFYYSLGSRIPICRGNAVRLGGVLSLRDRLAGSHGADDHVVAGDGRLGGARHNFTPLVNTPLVCHSSTNEIRKQC